MMKASILIIDRVILKQNLKENLLKFMNGMKKFISRTVNQLKKTKILKIIKLNYKISQIDNLNNQFNQ